MARLPGLSRWKARHIRGLPLLGLALLTGFVLSGCTGRTTGATSITATSATLNASVTWKDTDYGEYWIQYSSNGGASWASGTHQVFGSSNASCTSSGAPERGPITPSFNVAGLSPSTHYIYRLAGTYCGSNPNNPFWYDSQGSANGTNYSAFNTLALPTAPTLTGTSPQSPANNNNPKIIGTAPAGSTVNLYTGGNCSGTPDLTGTAADFASPGLTYSVPDDVRITFRVSATTSAGTSACSSGSVTYVEESTAPTTTIVQQVGLAGTHDDDQISTSVDAHGPSASGVKRLELDLPGGQQLSYETQCSPICPASVSRTFTYRTGSMPDGGGTALARAKSPSGLASINRSFHIDIHHVPPQITGLTHTGLAGWHNNDQLSTTVQAQNAGLGVKRLELDLPSGQQLSYQDPCSPSCPTTLSHTFTYSTDTLPEGVGTASVRAKSPTDGVSPDSNFQIQVDRSPPAITNVSHVGLPGWHDEGQISTTVDAQDPDSGIQRLDLDLPGGQQLSYEDPCSPNCPTTLSHTFTYSTGNLPEGSGTASVRAKSPSGSNSPASSFQIKADHSGPTIEPSGGLGSPGALGTVLTINATDGDPSDPATARSGVSSVELLVDDERASYAEQPCAGDLGSCPLNPSLDYHVNPGVLPRGQHNFKVIAKDQLRHERVETWRAGTKGRSPAAAYSFEGGSARDSLGDQDLDGTIHGAAFTPDGKSGDALDFDGQNDYVSVPGISDALDLTGKFTVEAWVKPDQLPGPMTVLGMEYAGPNPYSYLLDASSSSGTPIASIQPEDGSLKTASAPGPLPLQTWSHLAVTYDGSQMSLLINGTVVDTTSSAPPRSSDGDLQIGGSTLWGDYFDGKIDEVRVYQGVLDPGELGDDIQAPVDPPPTPDPVAAYSFQDTTRFEGFGADGSIQGATLTPDGKYGNALDFDGEDDYVSIWITEALDRSDRFTIEAWVNPDQLQGATSVLGKAHTGSDPPYAYVLRASSPSGSPQASIQHSDESQASASALDPLPLHTWSHLALTYDGQQMSLLINGSVVDTTSSVPPLASAGNLRIGGSELWGEYFSGKIDEVRAYDEALGTEEVRDDMNSAVHTPASNQTLAGLGFDQRQGSTAYSFTSNHDGSIDGAQWTEGKHGAALAFDGVDDRVTVADADDLDLPHGFTLAAWVRPVAAGGVRPIISKQSATGAGYQLDLGGDGGAPRISVGDGQTVHAASAPQGLPTGKWSHLAATQDGTHLLLYVNGKPVKTAPSAPPMANNRDLLVGSDGNGGNFKGDIDEVNVDDSAIPSEAVAAIQRQAVAGGLTLNYFQSWTGQDMQSYPVGSSGAVVHAEWGANIKPGYGGLYTLKVVAEGPGSVSCSQGVYTWDPWHTSCAGGAEVPWSMVNDPPTLTYHAEVVDRNDPSKVYASSAPLTVDFYVPDYQVQLIGYNGGPGEAQLWATAGIRDDGEAVVPKLVIRDSDGEAVPLCEDNAANGNITACHLGAGRYRATVEGFDRVFGYSEWLTVHPEGWSESSMKDGVDLYSLAGMFSGATSICNAFLHWGTHLQGSSTSDQFNDCEAAQLAGASTTDILKAVAGAAAGSGALAYLWWYAHTYGNPGTGVVDGTEDTSVPGATPAPATTYPATMGGDIQVFRQRSSTEVGAARAESIFRACLVLATRNQCLKRPIFVSGSSPQVEPATAHARSALFAGKPVLLHYLAASDRPGRWYVGDPRCTPLQPLHDCDEYPPKSTTEGGPGASLRQVPSSANRSQGASLKAFYSRCKMGPGTGKSFLFIPMPEGTGMPSTGIC
jgi:concanavalin A-like lectin/glucanase superfamily protein/deoxyribonuclease NucA/NucB